MRKTVLYCVIPGMLLGAVGAMCLSVSIVTSTSMQPTVEPGQHILTLLRTPRLPLLERLPRPRLSRGDLVVLHRPGDGRLVLKRIVALAHDHVKISEGVLFVNDRPVPETYARHGSARLREADVWPAQPGSGSLAIPADMVFVLGDNRSEAADSRIWGAIALSDVVAKTLLVLP